MEANMSEMSATDAKNRFGEMLDMAQREPVRIRKNGRDVAVVLSVEEYQRLRERDAEPVVRPLVERLLARSLDRRGSLYKALAK
jgi:prevent-host-death family protein